MIYDVIIIGCGISGLNTAYQLLCKNSTLKILLLEKSNFLGGRIKTFSKNIQNHNYTFEEGAGRLNSNHKLLLQLIEHFNLSSNLHKIGSDITFTPSKGTKYKDFINKSPSEFINKVIKYSKNDSKENMQKYTFIEYCKFVLNDKEIKYLLDSFGYYAELTNMNAYDKIKLYSDGIKPNFQYYSLRPRLDIIIKKLEEQIRYKNGKILLNNNVNNIIYNSEKEIFNIYLDSKTKVYKCKFCVLAIPKPELLKFNILEPIQSILNSVNCKSLCRIYSIFNKKDIWFKDIPTTTTNNKSRFIIPIDKDNGLIMISYTDSKFADYWNNLYLKNNSLFMYNLKNNIYKTFNKRIENPIYTKISYWNCGSAYWKKNKDSSILSKKIIKPINDINLFICGENYSEIQGWIEGALETSHMVVNKINDIISKNFLLLN